MIKAAQGEVIQVPALLKQRDQVSDPAEDWQVCLAHQLRDCQYGIDAGDTLFSPRMKRIVLRTCAWHRRWAQLSATGVADECDFPQGD